MQNKSTYLRRLLAIYVAFFVVLLAGLTLELAPDFSRGMQAGTALGKVMNKQINQAVPQTSYLLWNLPVKEPSFVATEAADSLQRVAVSPSNITIHVTEPMGNHSLWWYAFAAVGGTPWCYLLLALGSLAYLAIIVLMWLIIRSVRRSIREEQPLATCNVWRLRTIALLAIGSELCNSLYNYLMAHRGAAVLAESAYRVCTSFQFDYSILILGLLILFAAELTAIGRDLGEEQKLTI